MLKDRKRLILLVIVIMIIIAGIITILKCGLSYELLYGKSNKIEIELGFNYDKSKIETIVKDLFDTYEIQTAGLKNSTAVITAKNISDEQKTSIVEKVNEAYGLQLTKDNLETITFPTTDIKIIIKQYIASICISVIMIEIYLIIRFKKIGFCKILLVSLITIILSQVVAISLIAILRVELGPIIMPMLLAIFIADWYIINTYFEKEKLLIQKHDNKDVKK